MYFPKLFELINYRSGIYDARIISYIDDFLGSMEEGTTFSSRSFNGGVLNILETEEILGDLSELGIIAMAEEDTEADEYSDNDNPDNYYILLVQPKKILDENYIEYQKNKRKLDSFSIMYEKTKKKRSGALTLIDLKGYSKNVNKEENNSAILLLVERLQAIIDESLHPYFLNSYSGIEIKHNGDGWFMYFLNEEDSYRFLTTVINRCFNTSAIYSDFVQLQTSLKCYIHHSKEIEKIYKVDSMHFDMEGKDVILIHMLEKPIEEKLYSGVISKTSSFIAITESVIEKLDLSDRTNFKPLIDTQINIQDSEGKNKIYNPNIKIFYQEMIIPVD